MNPKTKLSSYQVTSLSRLIKRREKGEPMAYILGYKDFCGLRFKVNKNVLVPRPETEELVNQVFKVCKVHKATLGVIPGLTRNPGILKRVQDGKIKILDVGTGSGCIAVTIAKEFQISNFKFQITASDISLGALKVAKENAKIHHAHIKFIESDLLNKIKFVPDILIANLPYGWQEWKNNTTAATIGLKFEPKTALFTKEKGLYEIHRLLKQIAALPRLPKYIYLEFDPRQKNELGKLIKKTLPKAKVKFYKDYTKKWRFAEIK